MNGRQWTAELFRKPVKGPRRRALPSGGVDDLAGQLHLDRAAEHLEQDENPLCGRLAVEPPHHVAMKPVIYLPPYSPDLNPIEQAFAKLKALLRKAAARTVDDLWRAIADALKDFEADECANFFQNAGYASKQP